MISAYTCIIMKEKIACHGPWSNLVGDVIISHFYCAV